MDEKSNIVYSKHRLLLDNLSLTCSYLLSIYAIHSYFFAKPITWTKLVLLLFAEGDRKMDVMRNTLLDPQAV